MLRCGACCAPDASGTWNIEEGKKKADGSVIIPTRTFDQDHGEPSNDNVPDIMGRKLDNEPQLPKKGPQGEEVFFKANVSLEKGAYPAFNVDLSDSPFLRISKIETEGPVADYNATVDQSRKIVEGDFIVAVNGISGSGKDMMGVLSYGGDFELAISRAKEIELKDVDKQDHTLGIDLTYQARSMSIVIKDIFPNGAVAKYNATAAPDMQVKENDHIISVCGKMCPSRQLLQHITDNVESSSSPAW